MDMTKIPKKDSNGNFAVIRVQDNTMAWKLSGNYFASFYAICTTDVFYLESQTYHVIMILLLKHRFKYSLYKLIIRFEHYLK